MLSTLPLLCLAATAPDAGVVAFFDSPATPGFSRATPAQVGLDEAQLRRVVADAERTRSSALVVLRHGKVVVDRTFDRPEPVPLMSVTKSVVSLAVGTLIAQGKIPSVDAPLSTWFPEFAEGPKAKVTLRHVLSQTSGLAHQDRAGELYRQPDMLAFVRALPLVGVPGEQFSYSNEATQLLSGVVAQAAGEEVDRYVARTLFTPLGIKTWSWDRDTQGHAHTFAGLSLTGRDLATVGQLLLKKGVWKGKAVLPAAWLAESTAPARADLPQYGWLWWVRRTKDTVGQAPEKLAALADAGFGAIEKLAPLAERRFDPGVGYWLEAGALLEPSERSLLSSLQRQGLSPLATAPGPQVGFSADGWLGQRLAVYPAWGLVVVRLHRPMAGNDDAENAQYGFNALLPMLEAAVR